MNTAVVFNVQRFSLHDGPGIRTTVFLKGCPLQCAWCHNPESRDGRPDLALRPERCLTCGSCVAVCPAGTAGHLAGQAVDGVSADRCQRCGACAEACPTGARELLGRLRTVDDLLAEVERDRFYHEESGGGVTFSGGEPLSPANAPFVLDCLTAAGQRGLHRTVDTCGHVDTDTLLAAARQAELILYDLKIMDSERHRRATGVGNERVLGNLRALAAAGRRVWIRVPLVPGLTDDEENLTATARFAASLGAGFAVHLLPYHRTGGQKYGRLGLGYGLEDLRAPAPARVAACADLVREFGLDVQIGG